MTAVLSALAGPAAAAIAPLPAPMVARAAIADPTTTRWHAAPSAHALRRDPAPFARLAHSRSGSRLGGGTRLDPRIAMAIKLELGSEPTQVDAIHALRS